MKNFIKQNWFKVGLLAVAIVVVFFYLLLWQPAQKRKEALANNIKCQQEGSQLVERAKKELLRNEIYGLEPQFRFSDELNTCLYLGKIVSADDSGSMLTSFIKDVYTNKDLASYNFFMLKGKTPSIHGDTGKYELLRKKYFPE